MSNGPNHKLYEFWGVDIPEEPNGSNQYVTDCPFCGHSKHFYIDADTSMYQCKDSACSMEGNPYTFLAEVYRRAEQTTVPFHSKKLSYFRKKFPGAAYEGQFAYDRENKVFLFADRNAKGSLCNLSRYGGDGPVFGSPGCSQHFFGIDELAPEGPVFICEGRWDRYALRYLLSRLKENLGPFTVLGAPGASNVPKADLEYLAGRDVYLFYDNDEAGRNGAKSACRKLHGHVGSLHLLAWPEGQFPDKYDLEDLIRESPSRPDQLWKDILSWCFRYQVGADPNEKPPELVRTNFNELLQDFTETGVHMYPGLRDCLALTLAVVYSTKLSGEPLWLYAIGDPGRGKSLVLDSTLGSYQCLYRTSVTHKAFINGFRNTEGGDNSLLALLPGKALIIKDYSNVLSLPHVEQEQLVSLLREAYDGRIVRNFGNNLYREYPPADSPFRDCRFSLVAGVTKEIHAKSHAGLGERFLKYEIPCTEDDNLRAMMAALDDNWKTHERQMHRSAAVGSFLDRRVNFQQLPNVPDWYKQRLIALSEFVGLSRSPVSRTRGDLDYSPSAESGTRVAKQLRKLTQSLCFVFNQTEPTEEIYRLVRKVAWDTAHSWRRDLSLCLFHEEKPLNTHEVTEVSNLSLGTCHRQLHDMKALRSLRGRKENGQMTWSMTDKLRGIITEAHLENV